MKCLITNEICPANNKKCKICRLDSCKEVMKMIDIYEYRQEKKEETILKEQLPQKCRDCSFLNITDLKNKKVYCPYMIKECILK